jgi:hypothetical protein
MGKTPTEKAHVLPWLMFQMGGVGPMFGQMGFFVKFAGSQIDDPRPRDRYAAEAKRLLAVIDKQLDGQDGIVGDYSIADIAIAPWLGALAFYGAQDLVGYNDLKNVPAYVDRFTKRPAVQRGRNSPARPTDAPTGFAASDQGAAVFLGRQCTCQNIAQNFDNFAGLAGYGQSGGIDLFQRVIVVGLLQDNQRLAQSGCVSRIKSRVPLAVLFAKPHHDDICVGNAFARADRVDHRAFVVVPILVWLSAQNVDTTIIRRRVVRDRAVEYYVQTFGPLGDLFTPVRMDFAG